MSLSERVLLEGEDEALNTTDPCRTGDSEGASERTRTSHTELDAGGLETLSAMVLGGSLPAAAESHLREAGLAYANACEAEKHLDRASAEAPGHPAVLIARYRYLFYKNRLSEALEVARDCLSVAARMNGLPQDWRRAEPGAADFSRFEHVPARFYLFTLKAYGYLLLRLGQLALGRAAVEKLLELDVHDRVGGKVLLAVIDDLAERGESDA